MERVSLESAFLSFFFSCVSRFISGFRWLFLKFFNRFFWAFFCLIYISRILVTDVSIVGDVRVRKYVIGKRVNWKIKDFFLFLISYAWFLSFIENKKVSLDLI